MNVKKAIRKIVALGTGAIMIGATIMGATAYSLADYPAPFVTNGAFSGKIVIGAAASTADVLGAVDIAASLQAAAKTDVIVGGTTSTTSVEGGVLIEDSSNQDFNYGDTMSTTAFKKKDFPELLKDGIVEDDSASTEDDYDQSILVGSKPLKYSLVDNDVYSEPVMYLNIDDGVSNYLLTFKVEFDSGDELDIPALGDSETIEMFGQTFTFKNVAVGDDIVLYGSDVTQMVTMGTPIDIEVDGETYTVSIVGANSDGNKIHLQVNDDVKALDDTTSRSGTVGGLKVYIEDIFISNVGGEQASAKLFIGSKEINLGKADGTWNPVQIDNVELDGVEVNMTDTGSDVVSKIYFRIDPEQIENDATGEKYKWLALGDTFVDPMFGVQVNFVEAVPGLMDSSRDYVGLKVSGEDLNLEFTNEAGDEYELPIMQKMTGADNVTFLATNEAGEKFGYFASGTSMVEGAIFILEEDATSTEPVSRIFKYKGLNSDDDAVFADLAASGDIVVSDGDALEDTGVTVTVVSTSAETISLNANTKLNVYTESGMKISWDDISNSAATATITFVEDEQGANKDEITGDTFAAAVTYDSADEELNIAKPSSWLGGADDSYPGGKVYYGISNYGTYYVHDSDDALSLELYVPPEDVDYHIYLAGPDSAVVSVGGSSEGTYYNVNPIAVGVAVLDSDAPAVGSDYLIVVGGPCANSVAAELMGSPADCAAGFEEGKGVIKYWDENKAILVAGYSAKDTQGASRVLANFEQYSLVGDEVEVLVPSLSSLSVNPVQ
ncbi:MAG: hypothetical protein KKB65_07205 [Nanoarchaeota archaeon]|nr:hypothetical protein [Nanoarchaeota archaeon]MBU1849657.1 hypothetical protein [Nanoarchaeota archaeon]